MGYIDDLPFEPDDELRRFLLEFERTGGKMDEDEDQSLRAAHSVHQRTKLTNLYQTRLASRLTQAELACKVGASRRSITAIENGLSEPSVFLALALAEALNTTVEELFHLKPPELPPDDVSKGQWMLVSKAKKRQSRR